MCRVLSVVVVRAAHVLVVGHRPACWRSGLRLKVQSLLQDRFDVLAPRTASHARAEPAFASRVHTRGAVALASAQQAQASAVALLGIHVPGQGQLDDPRNCGPKLRTPRDQTFRRPQLVAMVLGAMLWRSHWRAWRAVAALVRGDAFAVVEDLDDGSRGSHLHTLMDASVVHAVVALVVFDVVVDVHTDIVAAI